MYALKVSVNSSKNVYKICKLIINLNIVINLTTERDFFASEVTYALAICPQTVSH